jgi:hypothetical protein
MALQSSKPPWTSSDHSDIKANHPERCNNTIGLLADLSLLTDPLILVQVPSCYSSNPFFFFFFLHTSYDFSCSVGNYNNNKQVVATPARRIMAGKTLVSSREKRRDKQEAGSRT